MDVIVVFDKYGYGGLRQMVDVVAVPRGTSDQDVFDAWAGRKARASGMSKEEIREGHGFLYSEVRRTRIRKPKEG